MAILPEENRLKIWRGLMRYWSSTGEEAPFTKANLKDAIDAIDLFMDNNALTINNAFPQPFRSNATVEQKAVLLSGVVAMRYTEEWLRRLVGEVR